MSVSVLCKLKTFTLQGGDKRKSREVRNASRPPAVQFLPPSKHLLFIYFFFCFDLILFFFFLIDANKKDRLSRTFLHSKENRGRQSSSPRLANGVTIFAWRPGQNIRQVCWIPRGWWAVPECTILYRARRQVCDGYKGNVSLIDHQSGEQDRRNGHASHTCCLKKDIEMGQT